MGADYLEAENGSISWPAEAMKRPANCWRKLHILPHNKEYRTMPIIDGSIDGSRFFIAAGTAVIPIKEDGAMVTGTIDIFILGRSHQHHIHGGDAWPWPVGPRQDGSQGMCGDHFHYPSLRAQRSNPAQRQSGLEAGYLAR